MSDSENNKIKEQENENALPDKTEAPLSEAVMSLPILSL